MSTDTFSRLFLFLHPGLLSLGLLIVEATVSPVLHYLWLTRPLFFIELSGIAGHLRKKFLYMVEGEKGFWQVGRRARAANFETVCVRVSLDEGSLQHRKAS